MGKQARGEKLKKKASGEKAHLVSVLANVRLALRADSCDSYQRSTVCLGSELGRLTNAVLELTPLECPILHTPARLTAWCAPQSWWFRA